MGWRSSRHTASCQPIDLLPKGIEIRTPVCSSIEQCLQSFETLHARMQAALFESGFRAVALSHHPLEDHFEGPQNRRRYDYWQWAMQVMTTYGPDINVALPPELSRRCEPGELNAKVNYYGPALAAPSMASPFCRGALWHIRGEVGKSLRTYRRSVVAPAIELHPEENGRMEFKLFEMSARLEDYAIYLLLWLTLLLDDGLRGRACDQSRVYDLGCIARHGVVAETVLPRASEVLERAPAVLASHGFDPQPLNAYGKRLESGRVPADGLIELYEQEGSITGVLRHLVPFSQPVARDPACSIL